MGFPKQRFLIIRHCITALLLILASATAACAQEYSDDVKWLIDVLELEQGSVVAEIGAGDGDETLQVARYIGTKGHIYSSELGTESIEELQEAIDNAARENITVVEGHPTRANLPKQCCNAIYMRRVYHHFGDPPSMNASILQSLKPGGRLAIIDFAPRGSEADPGDRASGNQHGVTAATVVEELREAGFILISSEERAGRNFCIVMKKPDGD